MAHSLADWDLNVASPIIDSRRPRPTDRMPVTVMRTEAERR